MASKVREHTVQFFTSFAEMDEVNRLRLLAMTPAQRVALVTRISDNENDRPSPRSTRTYRVVEVPLL